MRLDKYSSIPLYYQLKELMLERIETGEYPPGEKIPSEPELCESLDISRPTVRQAISELVAEGKLNVIRGKGTFVTSPEEVKVIENFNSLSFSFFSLKETGDGSIINVQLIKDNKEEIGGLFSDDNLLREGIVLIERLIREEGITYGYVQSYIPFVLFPNLIEDISRGKTIVDICANKYAYIPVKGKSKIMVSQASSDIANYLKIGRGSPVLCISSKLVSRSETVTELTHVYLRSDISALSL